MADDLRAAVQSFVGEPVVTRFLLVVESMDADDGMHFQTISDLMSIWDVRGFLRHALEESYEVIIEDNSEE